MGSVSEAATGPRPAGHVTRLVGYGLLMILATGVIVTLHELTHILSGRAVGLPTILVSPTAVGLPSGAPAASVAQLIVLACIAPFATMVEAVLIFLLVTRFADRLPRPLPRFLGWVTVFGLPYIGLETFLIGSYGDLRGNGPDFAVTSVALGVAAPGRTVIAALGAIVLFTMGFVLRFSLAAVDGAPVVTRVRLAGLFQAVPVWRRIASILLLLIVLAFVLLGLVQTWLGRPLRYSVLALIVWSLAVAFVVPWRAPGPGAIFRNWLAPGLLAGAAMGVFGLLTQSDYFLVAIVIVASLCSAAWAQSPVCTAASHAAVSTED